MYSIWNSWKPTAWIVQKSKGWKEWRPCARWRGEPSFAYQDSHILLSNQSCVPPFDQQLVFLWHALFMAKVVKTSLVKSKKTDCKSKYVLNFAINHCCLFWFPINLSTFKSESEDVFKHVLPYFLFMNGVFWRLLVLSFYKQMIELNV